MIPFLTEIHPADVHQLNIHLQDTVIQDLYFSYNDLYEIYSDAVRSTHDHDREMVKNLVMNPPRPPSQTPSETDFIALGNTLFVYGLIG